MTRRPTLLVALALAATTAACGDDEPVPPLTTTGSEPAAEAPEATAPEDGPPGDDGDPAPPPEDKPSGPAESGAGDPRVTELEREAERVVRAYVAALDARDGERACELLAPDALRGIELPEPRPGCPAALAASIGYRDARGLPVWEGAEVSQMGSVEVDGATAKVVATVVTRFADRDEVSIEDDVIYLERAGDGWVVVQPSSTFYRAIGAEPPPGVIAPPPGNQPGATGG